MATSITIDLILASSCNHCSEARKTLQSLVNELNDDRIHYREINVLDDLDYAVSLGVLRTPAIAIDGELVFAAIPSLKCIRTELQIRLMDLSI